jgi:RNA polymerase sigma-70 factor (ECF subfamily)
VSYRHATVNGQPGLLQFTDGKLSGALTLVTDGVRILEIYSVRNPDKLRSIHLA